MTRCEESMGLVARAPWDMLEGLHGTCCKGSLGLVARAPWDMLEGLREIYCKDMLQGLQGLYIWHDGTCSEGSM